MEDVELPERLHTTEPQHAGAEHQPPDQDEALQTKAV